MTTYRQLIYMVLDELKGVSDDFFYTEDHIMFLLDKYRAFLLKQKYANIKKMIPQSNYQVITIKKENSDNIPSILNIATPIVEKEDSTVIFNYCYPNRIKFTGEGNYTKNIQYFTIDNIGSISLIFKKGNTYNKEAIFSDNSLNSYNVFLLTDSNVQDLNPIISSINYNISLNGSVYLKAVFESPVEVYRFNYDHDIQDLDFPLEEGLIPPLLEMTVKDLSAAIFKPEDRTNDGADDTGNMAHFIARNTKSDLAKQIYG